MVRPDAVGIPGAPRRRQPRLWLANALRGTCLPCLLVGVLWVATTWDRSPLWALLGLAAVTATVAAVAAVGFRGRTVRIGKSKRD